MPSSVDRPPNIIDANVRGRDLVARAVGARVVASLGCRSSDTVALISGIAAERARQRAQPRLPRRAIDRDRRGTARSTASPPRARSRRRCPRLPRGRLVFALDLLQRLGRVLVRLVGREPQRRPQRVRVIVDGQSLRDGIATLAETSGFESSACCRACNRRRERRHRASETELRSSAAARRTTHRQRCGRCR